MKKTILFTALALNAFLFSCKKENNEAASQPPKSQNSLVESIMSKSDPGEKYNIFKGPQVSVGNGRVRSWVKINHLGQPAEIGVEFTPNVLIGLPEHENFPGQFSYTIPLHQKAKEATPFDHIELDWNPQGHEPAIFEVPHFDVHFYMINEAEQQAIPVYTQGSAFDILPPLAYQPAGYIPTAGGVPAMGKHWIAPPIIPPFTRVLIWGSYNGKMTFIEPMVTRTFLQSGVTSSMDFGQPQLFPKPGNYPTRYNIYKADDQFNVSLSNFVAR